MCEQQLQVVCEPDEHVLLIFVIFVSVMDLSRRFFSSDWQKAESKLYQTIGMLLFCCSTSVAE